MLERIIIIIYFGELFILIKSKWLFRFIFLFFDNYMPNNDNNGCQIYKHFYIKFYFVETFSLGPLYINCHFMLIPTEFVPTTKIYCEVGSEHTQLKISYRTDDICTFLIIVAHVLFY